MRVTAADRKRVKKWVSKWRPNLFLGEWFITHLFEKIDKNNMTLAHIVVDPTYLRANLHYYPNFWTQSKREQEETIVHELAHCLTQRMHDINMDLQNFRMITVPTMNHEWELLTQRIANVALNSEWNK